MNTLETQLDRLQTPREDRTALVAPSAGRVADLVAENLRLRDGRHYDLQGRSLADISVLAREELCEAAGRWTAAYRNVPTLPPDPRQPIFLAGHQPQMFHPGVWFKNFVLGGLAERHGARAINLIVDGDTLSEASLRVPGGSVADPQAAQIPFDRSEPKIPYEERKIEDRELFASFGRRVIEQIGPLVADPLIERYWPLVLERARHGDNLGACLAQARHQLECDPGGADILVCRRGLGGADILVCPAGGHLDGRQECLPHRSKQDTLEVPLSWVCAGEAFQWFVAHLLARLPQFRVVYNSALREYRGLHHVRSLSHPAPDLAEDGPWIEAPLWVWTADDPRRRRLFARAAGVEIVLSDRGSWQVRLPLSAEGDAGRAVERLMELQRGNVRIRPRAMMTTLWARLALGDLFIHGIGGAKYDRVTDLLMERFFGLPAPGFMVVSATLHLPIEQPHATAADVRAIQHELREMTYHPERYLTGGADIPVCPESLGDYDRQECLSHPDDRQECLSHPLDLTAAKRRWIETAQTRGNARARCHAIRQINAALQSRLEAQRRRLIGRQAAAARLLRAESILAWREYAFCLYPDATLREFLSRLLEKSL
jgi:hypothetical protein